MQKFLIFISEQWLLVSLLSAAIVALAWLENRRAGPSLTSQALTNLVNREDAIIIDLRDKAEFEAGHIVDAINLPFNQWQTQYNSDKDGLFQQYKDKPLVFVCKLGQQSTFAAKRLQRESGPTVYRLSGGIMEWKASQMPLIQ